MDSGKTNGDDREREAERYRQAALHALGQLEWIIGYLHKIRKSQLANALDRNRKEIRERTR
jgi:hypothetical protein